MKIGIITLPLSLNYGGILQAYALQTALKHLGHEAEILDKPHVWRLRGFDVIRIYTKRIIKKIIGRDKGIPLNREKLHNKNFPIVGVNMSNFMTSYLNRREIYSLNDIKEGEYDAFVVGSDQVWRTHYYGHIEQAYLQFASKWKNIKRISYAPSFGTDKLDYSILQKRNCKKLIKKFDAVSVREVSTVNICKQYFNIDAKHVLDPTMLLEKEEYIRLFEINNTPKSAGTLLNYILDESTEKQDVIDAIANKLELIPFRVNSRVEESNARLEEKIQPPIESWLRGFYDAGFVVTDSFHACVFSIIFNKPFIVIGNEGRGLARFNSLLSMFGLESRLVKNMTEINWNSVLTCDFSYANQKLKELKSMSFDFLKDALSK